MRIKVNYKIGDFLKFVDGKLLEETDSIFKVYDSKGYILEIAKSCVIEVVRYEGSKEY